MNTAPTNTIRLIGISGSLRQASGNTAVLRALKGALPEGVEMTLLPLDGIPLYNQDLDGPQPLAAVGEFKRAIADCDGIVISSPEYNFGMSGVLKNALDWASRPAFASPLKGKPVLIITCSPAFTGGVRAQAQLRETLAGTLSRVIARPPVVIGAIHTKIDNGRLTDDASLQFALAAVDDLAAEIKLLRAQL
ncbi:NADPH-dependent FMN reductase [Pseudoduganella namucuonensis]|uniref:Chromate reductase n=1 Tax=Pseudoduganella namucuonensis TaxID=1035707 RepID=A0A1I7IGP3_9BURK|nr:NAD(P)H-dependent oxidoreductase [Pseudoduganella namucuonensis]SFU72117.1 chromate reductase [Pseudoduganella namucuonensis]